MSMLLHTINFWYCRVIFRWMTCRDFNSISFSDDVKPGSPEHLLLAFKSAKTTYARIFECLTRFVACVFLLVEC